MDDTPRCESWDTQLAVNVLAPVELMRLAVRRLNYIVSPGIVGTWMSYEFAERQGGAERVLAQHPLKEFIPPEEVARLVAFLASGAVRHLNGATLDVNGGAYIR